VFAILGVSEVYERWGAGVETQKNVLGVSGGWGRVPFNFERCMMCVCYNWVSEGYCVERWGAGVENQENVREEIGGWGRVP